MMSRVLIIYASLSGNTEQLAETMHEYLEERGHEVDCMSFDSNELDVDDLKDYDAMLVGTYTFDDGELPYEVEDFHDDLEDAEIRGMIAGVFGSGDRVYDTFGGAIDLMGDRLESLGAAVLPERFKVDLEPDDDDLMRAQYFAAEVCEILEEKLGA